MLKLKVKKVKVAAITPVMAHIGEDFGYDVFACLHPELHMMNGPMITIGRGEQKLIPTGLALEMEPLEIATIGLNAPESLTFKVGLIAKQPSGLALKRMLDVKAGVIDAGYRNEIQILLHNYGTTMEVIKHGDKIGQLVPVAVLGGEIELVDDLSNAKRGMAGWGSGQTDGIKTVDQVRSEVGLTTLNEQS